MSRAPGPGIVYYLIIAGQLSGVSGVGVPYAMLYTVVIDGKKVRLIRSTFGTPTPDTPESCPAMIKY